MERLYEGRDKISYYNLINGEKFRPVDIHRLRMVYVDEILLDKARRNREMVEHSTNQRPPSIKYPDYDRTAISGRIDRSVWKPIGVEKM
mgnify:CR=1 FL=1